MIHIDADKCRECGLCGRICPRFVVETTKTADGKQTTVNAEREAICIHCGQCVAICSTGAIQVEGIAASALRDTPEVGCDPAQLLSLLQHRRSVRRYRDKPVGRDVLEQVVEAVRWSPTASSDGTLGVIVVQNVDTLATLRAAMYDFYDMVDGVLRNPIKRWVMTRRAGKRKVQTLRDHAMPGVRWYSRWFREGTQRRDQPRQPRHPALSRPGHRALRRRELRHRRLAGRAHGRDPRPGDLLQRPHPACL